MENIKIPYGISNFKRLREEEYVYVDKIKYIEILENNPMSIYVRPRRFGKSLFTSMISYYYDISEKCDFEKLFKGLYIYDNPTTKKNSYYILKFNFSGMNISENKSIEEILVQEGKTQLKRYMEDKRLNEKENMKKFVIIFESFNKFNVYEIE